MIEAFSIIDILSEYCIDNGIFFIAGEKDYQNALMDSRKYEAYDKILLAVFESSPVITGGSIVSNIYSGEIALGQKCEDDTNSSLDETYQQKYNNRLRSLSESLATIIANISCENEFDVTGLRFRLDINQFDLNADFVTAQITLTV